MPYRILIWILCIYMIVACVYQPIQPWEHDLLANRKMRLDAYAIDLYFEEHIYYSKESSSGGQGLGGGGCGCN